MKEYTAQEKCRAVLAVWMERTTAATWCRAQGVSSSLFCQWQDRALSGILEALEPRGAPEKENGPALPDALRRLLERKVRVRELSRAGQRPLGPPRKARPRPAPAAVPA